MIFYWEIRGSNQKILEVSLRYEVTTINDDFRPDHGTRALLGVFVSFILLRTGDLLYGLIAQHDDKRFFIYEMLAVSFWRFFLGSFFGRYGGM
jgi:hypothetical protein